MKKFENPTIEIEKFHLTDIIATSICDDDCDDLPPSTCDYVL